MTKKRKAVLVVILAVAVGIHVALFAAGGQWRMLGIGLVVVDVISAMLLFGAISESRKLGPD